MGAGASFDESVGLIRTQEPGNEKIGSDLPQFSDDKKELLAQASANWHRMIVHANAIKKDENRREALQKVDNNTISMYNTDCSQEAVVMRSRSDISLHQQSSTAAQQNPSSPEKSRTSYELDDLDSPTTIEQKPRIERTPSRIQVMGAQFRREELERARQSTSPITPSKKRSTPSREYHEVTAEDLENLPPVRIDLKSRTSTSITIVWDVDFEALQALEKLVDQDGYQLRPTYEIMHRKSVGSGEPDLFGGAMKSKYNLWRPACDDTTKTSATIKHLESNTQYSFRIRRMEWSSDWGPEAVIRTGPGVPSDPTSLHAKEVTSVSVLLHWSVPDRDNGLPVLSYVLRMKPLGGEFMVLYRGKDRMFMAHSLSSNAVYIFEVAAVNRSGEGPASDRLAVRTMQPGSTAMTPWVEAIEQETGKLYYYHAKTGSSTWTLPEGALLDPDGSYRNKYLYLHNYFKSKGIEARRGLAVDMHNIRLSLRRCNILEETLRLLRLPSPQQFLAGPLRVSFVDEAGIDGGGLAREWAGEVMKLMMDSSSGLMSSTHSTGSASGDGAIIDIRASVLHGSECRWLFTSIGKFFAKLIIDEHVLGVKFNDLFLSWLTGKPPTLEDLKGIDPTMYRGLEWVLNNPVDDADFTFSASYELFDEQVTVDFIPNGRSVAVTDENKARYVDLMLAWLICGRYEPAMTYFIEAFHSIIPEDVLKHFSTKEMQLLLGGSPEIDVLALKAQAVYTGGYTDTSMVVEWFWAIVTEEMDLEMLPKLLTFITGCACVPSSGCLKPALTITMIDGDTSTGSEMEEIVHMLPRAHTCFNQIVLPAYRSREALKEKLLYAIENSIGAGFHMT